MENTGYFNTNSINREIKLFIVLKKLEEEISPILISKGFLNRAESLFYDIYDRTLELDLNTLKIVLEITTTQLIKNRELEDENRLSIPNIFQFSDLKYYYDLKIKDTSLIKENMSYFLQKEGIDNILEAIFLSKTKKLNDEYEKKIDEIAEMPLILIKDHQDTYTPQGNKRSLLYFISSIMNRIEKDEGYDKKYRAKKLNDFNKIMKPDYQDIWNVIDAYGTNKTEENKNLAYTYIDNIRSFSRVSSAKKSFKNLTAL